MHAATTNKNPLKNGQFVKHNLGYAKYNPYVKQFAAPHVKLIENETVLQYYIMTRQIIPIKIMETFAKVTRDKKLLKEAHMIEKAQKKIQ